MDAIQQFRSPLPSLAGAANFEYMKEEIFLGRQSGRYLDAPTARHDVLAVGAENFVEVLAPKQFPHASKLGVFRQRSTLRRLKGPVFSRSPCTSVVIAGSVEFVSSAAPCRDYPLLGKKRMHQQLSRSLRKAKRFGVAVILGLRACATGVVHRRLVHTMKQPGLAK